MTMLARAPQVRNESKIIRYTNYQVAANCKIITTYTHYKGGLHKHPQLLMHFKMKCTKCKLSSCNGQTYLCPFCKHTTVCQDDNRMHLLLKHNKMGRNDRRKWEECQGEASGNSKISSYSSYTPTPKKIAGKV